MKTETNPPSTDAKANRAHAINTITLEVNAATDLRSHDGGKWATVFAIHNRYRGADKPTKPVPIFVKFGAHTVGYAHAAIKKGVHFTVAGSLDHDDGEQKDFYRINAEQVRVHQRRDGK